jgi:hypothetical protein
VIDERLDQRCSSRFTYRALIEAGETWQRPRIVNLPAQAETWNAIRQLATEILDPVVDRFGQIVITYGFASATLTRHIRARIDTSRDQHAGHELRSNGNPICPRLGQAADFRIESMPSNVVAAWIVGHLPFDRLYFYGTDRPIHVSVGPQQARAIVEMIVGPTGRRVPQRRDMASFAERLSARR